ncbi:MAG: sodium ion-translocating decarboxylase subunit beta [Chloroflexi bacterium]|jgi:carboxybiotin decarboxylase|nr:sodium ion-translocating decarboxylase subunit beta [Chloroflexota bacterium]MBT5319804.1 sodium ion-translocating decarboxylase subunit beta [Chloroflexota bacterium]MBT6681047.1 sodium ion-translocating decarboxylase subunit beta [Chloroflexota bacterium]
MEFESLWAGFTEIGDDPRMVIMWAIAGFLFYWGIAQKKEPLLLLPIAAGILFANMPLEALTREAGPDGDEGLFRFFQENALNNDLMPLLIFMGLGAATDFEPVLSSPRSLLLGAGAQFGVFVALLGALLLSFTGVFDFGLLEAASIGIIGGADGPTTIFISNKMHEYGVNNGIEVSNIVGATTVAAYSYMALVPIIQPPVIKLLTTQRERRIRMEYSAKPVSRRVKIMFPILTTIVIGVLVPQAVPLIGIMMFGNLIRESGVVPRLANTAQNELMNIVIILLGLTVGSLMPGRVFLQTETIGIFLLGLFAFMVATVSGLLLAKTMNLFNRKNPINPMIGAAGVSAVPMAARVVQDMASKEDPDNFILMHAMGPNIAGVIGTATVAGILLNIVPQLVS